MLELFQIGKQHDYYLFSHVKIDLDLKNKYPNVKYVLSGSKKVNKYVFQKITLWQQIALPISVNKYNIDLLYSPVMTMPLLVKCKTIISIHDLAFRVYPEKFTLSNRLIYKILVGRSITRAAGILTISKNTKNDIVKYYAVNPNKISICYPSAGDQYKPILSDKAGSAKKQQHLKSNKYLLYVGTIEPRKNIINLLKAYNSLIRENEITCQLLIVGKKGWLYENIYNYVDDNDLGEFVIFMEYVSDGELVKIYQSAFAFIYISLYEGFGLPVLEAMKSGVPVITSNISSMPEVVGDSAIMVNPLNIDEIKGAILKVLNNRQQRDNLISKGLIRSQKFSWQRMALSVNDLFITTSKAL